MGNSRQMVGFVEKQYDFNSCLFHPCKLELFQALSNMEWYVKCPFSRECGVFAHRNMQNAYMGVLNRKVHDTYRKLNGTIMFECNCQASLKVSQSPLNPGRPFLLAGIRMDADSSNKQMWDSPRETKDYKNCSKNTAGFKITQKKTIPFFL